MANQKRHSRGRPGRLPAQGSNRHDLVRKRASRVDPASDMLIVEYPNAATRKAVTSQLLQLAGYYHCSSLNKVDWPALTRAHIHEFIESMLAAGYSQSAIQNTLSPIKRLVKVLRYHHGMPAEHALDIINYEPAWRKLSDNAKPDIKDLKCLFTHYHERILHGGLKARRDLAMWCLMVETGMTCQQIASLQLSDLGRKGAMIKLDGQSITLPVVTKVRVASWRKSREAIPGPLFCRIHDLGFRQQHQGISAQMVDKTLRDAAKKLNVPAMSQKVLSQAKTRLQRCTWWSTLAT